MGGGNGFVEWATVVFISVGDASEMVVARTLGEGARCVMVEGFGEVLLIGFRMVGGGARFWG